ncbi:hypothetical protein KY343_04310 [Candidatus Woesearchaeota archaeon]|nr:hypothetical protein [Candidatus Woesearchaeota archaeon]
MKYPKELVHKLGAKAGILMYVAQELPDIPQMPMVVKMPDESIDDFLKRVEEKNIDWPVLFRSSAAAELDGYEGDFPSIFLDRCNESDRVIEVIEFIENSPKGLKQSHLPDKINVIAVQESPSRFYGTFIKHPNQDEFYILSARKSSDPILKSTFEYRPDGGVEERDGTLHKDLEEVKEELEKIVKWHDKIVSLPLMDNSWTYQIEFGICPEYLFQVRAFKPVVKADFKVEKKEEIGNPLVIGATPKEGINVRIERNLCYAADRGEVINPNNEPSCLFDALRYRARDAHLLRNLQANLFFQAVGLLAHDDIKAMRRAQVSALYSDYGSMPEYVRKLPQDTWINIVSDGERIDIRKL